MIKVKAKRIKQKGKLQYNIIICIAKKTLLLETLNTMNLQRFSLGCLHRPESPLFDS